MIGELESPFPKVCECNIHSLLQATTANPLLAAPGGYGCDGNTCEVIEGEQVVHYNASDDQEPSQKLDAIAPLFSCDVIV